MSKNRGNYSQFRNQDYKQECPVAHSCALTALLRTLVASQGHMLEVEKIQQKIAGDETAKQAGRGGPTQVNGIFDRSMESAHFKFGASRLAARRHAA